MHSKRIGQIMIPLELYPHIPHWFTIRQAVAELEHSEIDTDGRKSLPRALLVFDETYELLGIVRRRDILSVLEPKFMHSTHLTHHEQWIEPEIDPDLVDISVGKMVEGIKKQAESPISDAMQPIIATIDFDDHVAKAIYLMVSKDLNLIPVLKDQNVVGVVRSVDVFREIAHIIL